MPGRGPVLVLWLDALVFLGFAGWGIVSPYSVLDVVGFTPMEAGAIAETRAMYGGLMAGMGAALVLCAVRREWTVPGLAVTTLAFAGLAGGRVTGMVLEHAWPEVQVWTLTAEVVAAVGNLAAWGVAGRARGGGPSTAPTIDGPRS